MEDNININNKNKMIAGNYLPAIISVIILVGFDQISKLIINSNLSLYDSIIIIPNVLDIHYIINNGAAWGILKDKQILTELQL